MRASILFCAWSKVCSSGALRLSTVSSRVLESRLTCDGETIEDLSIHVFLKGRPSVVFVRNLTVQASFLQQKHYNHAQDSYTGTAFMHGSQV